MGWYASVAVNGTSRQAVFVSQEAAVKWATEWLFVLASNYGELDRLDIQISIHQ